MDPRRNGDFLLRLFRPGNIRRGGIHSLHVLHVLHPHSQRSLFRIADNVDPQLRLPRLRRAICLGDTRGLCCAHRCGPLCIAVRYPFFAVPFIKHGCRCSLRTASGFALAVALKLRISVPRLAGSSVTARPSRYASPVPHLVAQPITITVKRKAGGIPRIVTSNWLPARAKQSQQ